MSLSCGSDGGAGEAGTGGSSPGDSGSSGGGASSGSSGGGASSGGSPGSSGGSPGSSGANTAGAPSGGASVGGNAGTAGSTGVPPVSVAGDDLLGWAAVPGDGVQTTTGGMGGRTVSARNAEELAMFAVAAEPLIIQIEGSFAIGSLSLGSNKTLIGMGANVTLSGSIRVRPLTSADPFVSNVIIRNIRLDASTANADDGGDGIHIERAHHVWVDHCEIWDAPDGNTDITHGSNWITLSWNKYRYTSNAPNPDHRFSNLIGHSENATETDRGRLKVTLHHNWWAEQVEQRMPRTRFGEIHVFNNYYTATGNLQTVAAGTESSLVVENNYFHGIKDPHFFHEGSTTAQIVANGNAYEQTTGLKQSGQGSAFDPPYEYALDPAEHIPAIVRAGAGPR